MSTDTGNAGDRSDQMGKIDVLVLAALLEAIGVKDSRRGYSLSRKRSVTSFEIG